MSNCGQACPYNTLNGCNVNEYNGICPLTNMAEPVGKTMEFKRWRYNPEPPTNADRFRAMSNQEQQRCVRRFWEIEDFADWLKQPVKEGEDDGR